MRKSERVRQRWVSERTVGIIPILLSFVLLSIGLARASDTPPRRLSPKKIQTPRARMQPPGPFALPDSFSRTPRAAKGAPGPTPNDAQAAPTEIVHLKLHVEVSKGMAAVVERVAGLLTPGQILLLDIKTFGGAVDAAVRIRDALLHLPTGVRSIAYINPRAISAGALIAYASDVIVVAPGATMGAATPISVGAGGTAKPVSEKIVSYMRKEMRATAEAKGRDGTIAEAMVDADIVVPGLSEKGKVLTLDGNAALRWGIASFAAKSVTATIARIAPSYLIEEQGWTWAEHVAAWLSSAAVSGLLMSIGMLGLMIGLYSGGAPLPLTIGGVCLMLFFFSHHITHLAGFEGIFLFAGGLALLAIEIFVVPGTFIAGSAGVLCIVGALFLGLVDFRSVPLDIQWEAGWIAAALNHVFAAICLTGILTYFAIRFLPRSPLLRPLILSASLKAGTGQDYVEAMQGKHGEAASDLRPAGSISIEGKPYDAVARQGYIKEGTPVEVIGRSGFQLVVRVVATPDTMLESE